jgi:hypothetical protein
MAGKRHLMSQRGIDFMNEWLRKNINADAFPEPDDERIKEYAEQCLADARAKGISKQEIEEDMGSVEDCIAEERWRVQRTPRCNAWQTKTTDSAFCE